MSKLKKHPEVVDENIEIFKEELSILSDEKLILIALGNHSHDILKKNLDGYEIYKIMHYSNWGGPEKYKEAVCPVLKKI